MKMIWTTAVCMTALACACAWSDDAVKEPAKEPAKSLDVFAEAPPPDAKTDWNFFQLGFLPGIPGGTQNSNVYGLKLGAPMVDGLGRVYGVEPSFLYSGTNYIEGAQGSWFGPVICRHVRGVQASGLTLAMAKEFYGLQAGLVVITDLGVGFQPGLVEVAKDFCGFQAGGVSYAEKIKGFQAAVLVNYTENLNGVQLGVINIAKAKGLQFGLLNVNPDGFLPFMILFNGAF